MNHKKNIHEILNEWGRHERRLPKQSDALKARVLGQCVSLQGATLAKPRAMSNLSLALTGLGALLLILPALAPQATPTPFSTPMAIQQEYLANPTEEKRAVPLNTQIHTQTFSPSVSKPMQHRDAAVDISSKEIPISDPREFLKTDYRATVRTRHVARDTERIRTVIRGFDGRIDRAEYSREWGSITFVLPAQQLSAFREELGTIMGARFVEESVARENLLPEKQALDARRGELSSTLETLNKSREDLSRAHARAINSIQNNINSTNQRLIFLAASTSTDPLRIAEINAEKQRLNGVLADEYRILMQENERYGSASATLETNMTNARAEMARNGRDNTDLIDTVDTVRGTITLQRITIWGIMELYISMEWMAWILIGGGILSYLVHRRRSQLVAF